MAKLHALPEEKKPNTLPIKLAALGILLVAGGITTFVFGNKKPAVKKTTGNVLGTEINVNSLQKKIETVSKPYISDLENASQSLLNSASQTVASLAADSADQAKNYALSVTLEKLIDQMNKLPQPAQEEIKKQICK